MEKQDKILEIAKQYFNSNNTNNITAETLAEFLTENEWRIYDDYDKQCKRCDIKMELDEREIAYTDDDVEQVLDKYEDYLGDSDYWRDYLNEAIYDTFEE